MPRKRTAERLTIQVYDNGVVVATINRTPKVYRDLKHLLRVQYMHLWYTVLMRDTMVHFITLGEGSKEARP